MQLYPLAESLTFEQGAAFPLVFETAYRMLVTKAGATPGEWALIWGIGGGVALAAFEICRALGVRTIVTSSNDEKLERASALGADPSVNHSTDDVVAAVKEATEGRGSGHRRRDGRRGDLGAHAAQPPDTRVEWSYAVRRAATARQRVSTASGGSNSSSTAPRWETQPTSKVRTSSSETAERGFTSTACSRSPRSDRPTNGWSRVRNSARSSYGSPSSRNTGPPHARRRLRRLEIAALHEQRAGDEDRKSRREHCEHAPPIRTVLER